MFSGIVEERGTVRHLERWGNSAVLEIAAQQVLQATRLGDSMAINGACLTVTRMTASSFTVDLAPETLQRTSLGQLRPGHHVNLERSLSIGSRLGGHFVQGHIDGVGSVRALQPDGETVIATFAAPSEVMRYVVSKGFVAIDGMSLTVVDRGPDCFSVSLIPYTLTHTIAGHYRVGRIVNLEADVLGKYVERSLLNRAGESRLTYDFLRAHGFTEGGDYATHND